MYREYVQRRIIGMTYAEGLQVQRMLLV